MVRPARNFFPPAPAGLRVGLYGGSFNPVHQGHVHVAQTAKKRLKLDAVWWLVSPGNPLKKSAGQAGYAQRVAGVEKTLSHMPGHYVCTAEAALGTRYSVDLMAAVLNIRPALRPVWVMGSDNLASFHLWRDWQNMAMMLPIAIIARPQEPMRARFSPMAQRFAFARIKAEAAPVLADQAGPAWVYLTAPFDQHSSTNIRAKGECNPAAHER